MIIRHMYGQPNRLKVVHVSRPSYTGYLFEQVSKATL